MRRLVATVVSVAALAVVAPVVSSAHPATRHPRVDPRLASTLAAPAPPASTAMPALTVLVQATSLSTARAGVVDAGLDRLADLPSIDGVVARGSLDEVRALTSRRGITAIEQNRPLHFALDTSRKAIRATEAMRTPGLQVDGTGESIAIVDGGTDGTHPMFRRADGSSRVVRNLRVACVDEACPVVPGPERLFVDVTHASNDSDSEGAGGHGTHVTGIAAGGAVTTSDGRSFSGVAPGADIVALGSGATIDLVAAIASLDWVARHHADPCGNHACPPISVVNNSWGPDPGPFDPASSISKVEKALVAAGVTVVFANGNGDELNDGGDGSDNRSNPGGQAPFAGVVSVANYDDGDTGTRDGVIDPSSSRGHKGHPETYPDLSAPGTSITSACRPYLPICLGAVEPDTNYGTISGTSMAAPHVAGTVALLQQAARQRLHRRLTPAEVEDVLEDTAYKTKAGAPYERDPVNPDGTTSFDKGHGLLDVAAALQRVLGLAATAPGPACPTGSILATDPKGDATQVAVAGGGSNVPTLDVVGVDVAGIPTKQLLVVSFRIADLTDANPQGTTGIEFEGTLTVGSTPLDVTAERSVLGSFFTAGSADIAGSFDPKHDTVTLLIPRKLLGSAHGAVVVPRISKGFSRRMYEPTPIGPVADSFAGACPRTVDIGG
ncbi:MAG: hypothetical protein QOD30_599 [Actinomycetota bacterium]|nr:hypothetical protein [Actinomycetota bacterium]